jgi:hypothetical protein
VAKPLSGSVRLFFKVPLVVSRVLGGVVSTMQEKFSSLSPSSENRAEGNVENL